MRNIIKFFRECAKENRPITVKLTNATDKRLIFRSLKYIRRYNETRQSLNLYSVYISEHLPKQFQDERKTLLPTYKEGKKCNKKLIEKLKMAINFLDVDGSKIKL